MKKPTWLLNDKVVRTLDARPLLAAGEHPLERVLRETANLNPGEVYEIITPFPPVPMIEKLEASGFASHTEQQGGEFHTYFKK